jgi:hypothetical protein
MDFKPPSRVNTATKPPGEGSEPKQRITAEEASSDQQGDEKNPEINVAQQQQQVPQPQLQSVLLPPRIPKTKHQRYISWGEQQLSPHSPQPQPQQPPTPVSFRLSPKISPSEESSALPSSSPLQQPVLSSSPDTSAMSSSPFDLGDAATGISLPPRRTATGTGNVSANDNCSSYNESPNNNGNNDCDYSATSSNSSKRKINLADLLKTSPYESEAETYILHALEDRDPTYLQAIAPSSSRNRANTGFSSLGGFSSAGGSDVLLPRVPEASTNLFLEEIQLGAAAATDSGSFMRMSQNGSGIISEGRETADFDSAAAAGSGQDAAGTGATTNATSKTTNAARSAAASAAAQSTRSFGRTDSKILQMGLTFHSESSSRRTARPPSPARPTHRHQVTTEETLLDLTNALDQVNEIANANYDASLNTSVHGGVQCPGTHGAVAAAQPPALTSSGRIIPGSLHTKHASGSADALAHNASVIFQRKPKLHTPASSELDMADSILPTTATAPGGGATSTRR